MSAFSEPFQSKSKQISRRMFVLSVLKVGVFISIISRLFYLQISENIKYRSLSDKNRFREWKLVPQRGLIEDFYGYKIADNTQTFQLHMIPEDVPNLEVLFFKLSKVINFSRNKRNSLLKRLKKRKPWEPIIISDNLSWPEFSRLNLFLHEMQGVKPVVALARKYSPDGSSSHIVGYVSDISVKDLEKSELLRNINVPGLKTGKNGLEKLLNGEIIGEPGIQRFEVNAYGKRIKELELFKGKEGKNFRTTIDQEVQKYTTTLMEGKSGSVCVMDIYTGDIISIVSSPTFDPNKFVHGISYEDWQLLISDKKKPLINKPLAGLYPPGSTIKPIVALSALENDVINPKKIIQCKGSIELYGQKYHCWKKKGHGFVNMREGMKQSCDVYFYEVARKLGIDRLAETARKFGLGKPVLTDLFEERSGVVPNTEWKKKYIGKNWYLGETLHAGIGQGYWQTSPLQLCLMMAQIANGGYKIKPRIILDGEEKFHDLDKFIADKKFFSDDVVNLYDFIAKFKYKSLFRNPENIKFVQDALFGATNEPMGTSYRSRLTKKDFIFAGKTGTSQVRRFTEAQRELEVKNEDLPYEQRDHALFVAFAPYKEPRYSISVVVEHGGSGSKSAAPIAKKVIKKVLEKHESRESIKGLEEIA